MRSFDTDPVLWTGAPAVLRSVAIVGTLLVMGSGLSPANAQTPSPGRKVYEKANCIGCHKWHGGGGGGYGGAALSLRETGLEKEQIVEVVRCGRPGTGMPYHDRESYTAKSCYGMGKDDAGKDLPPRARTFLNDTEIDAVAEYILTAMKAKGPATHEDCLAFWGQNAKECQSPSR